MAIVCLAEHASGDAKLSAFGAALSLGDASIAVAPPTTAAMSTAAALQNDLLDQVTVTVDHDHFPDVGQAIPVRRIFELMHGEAIAVRHRGRLVVHETTHLSLATPHAWMSVSKLLINALLGHCVWRYDLDLQRPLGDFLGSMVDASLAAVPLQRFADMDIASTSNEADYQDPAAPFWQFGAALGWFAPKHFSGTAKEYLSGIQLIDQAARDNATDVWYTGAYSQLLGWVVERILGLPLVDCIQQLLWQPSQPTGLATISVDAERMPFMGGGMASTLADLMRFGQIYANNGVATDGSRVFAADWLQQCRDGGGARIVRTRCYRNHQYTDGRTIMHQGHSGQALWIDPESETIIGIFSAEPHPLGMQRWSGRAQTLALEALGSAVRESL